MRVARCAVEQLMRRHCLRGMIRGKVVCTAISDPGACPVDRLNRKSKASRLNELCISDFIHVSTLQVWLYLAFVVDVFALRLVGRRVSGSMRLNRRCTTGAPMAGG